MCGIIGFVTNNPKEYNALRTDYIGQGLYVNALRGQHSTGLFYVADGKATYAKDAVDARLFLQQQHFKNIIDDVRKDVHVCVGHNRHATLGTRGVDNAHPLGAGKICMVHNGTLRAYSSMPKHAEGDSDSARLAQYISESPPGFFEQLPDLEGDYALVWHDSRVNSMYFVTNGRRPLSYLRATDHILFASEGMMAKWLMSRLSPIGTKLPRIQHFRPFTLYTLPVGTTDWTMKTFTETKRVWVVSKPILPTPARTETGVVDYYDMYGQRGHQEPANPPTVQTSTGQISRFPSESKTHAKKRTARSNQILAEAGLGLRVGDSLDVHKESMQFYQDSKNQYSEEARGLVEGYVSHFPGDFNTDEAGEAELVILTIVHQVLMSEVWHDNVDTVRGELASAYVDANNDIVLTSIYKEIGAFHKPVSNTFKADKTKWPAYISEYFGDQRHLYTPDDTPCVPWLESTCVLTSREADMLLADKKCTLCDKRSQDVHWKNLIFLSEDTFVCRQCNTQGQATTDEIRDHAAKLNGKNNVIVLPSKTRVRVNHAGDVVDANTKEILIPKT